MTDYKSYFWTAFLLVLIIVSSLTGFKLAVMHASYHEERVVWQTKTDIINHYRKDYPDELVLGTSVALAVNPLAIESRSGKKVINLSVGGGRMPYHYFALKRILSQRKDIKKVYINTTRRNENTFSYGLNDAFGERMVRWFINAEEAKEMESLIPGTVQMYKDTRFMGSKYFFSRDQGPWYKFDLGNYLHRNSISSSRIMTRTIRENRGYFLFGDKLKVIEKPAGKIYSFEDIDQVTGFDPGARWNLYGEESPITAIYAEKIVQLLKEHGIDYEFFFVPLPQIRVQNEGPGLAMGSLNTALEEFGRDKVSTKILVLPNEFFRDISHLNAAGAKIFNEYFTDYVMNDQNPEGTYETVDFQW